ncbi:HNH endonuclease [Photobacterium sanguinicancri]|uniref:HNH endonuclease signature motif containing protein n=1 Tax=Photobacterium sanguinicancri TaxID=875932 RepID=A0AAW7Y1U6_9GAMM|nr:HNH endonuclease signature motif containing protein [Photobacterium sanguinicancri]MDO6542556.1 HNH endonuclease signature motif containing protein [Photobacterium sanguinicancri]
MAKRKAIPIETRLRLFAESSGHCQRPECLDPLFPAELNGVKHIAEIAHVLPHGKAGPRSKEVPSGEFNPDSFDNLILLCPKCHTIIDKNPDAYPRAIILEWKRNHLTNLAIKQGIRLYENRSEARAALISKLSENKAIWKKFAPIDGSEFEFDPESETALLWKQRMKSVILPNNYHTQSILATNVSHMTADEHEVFAEFKEHIRGLTDRHICGVAGQAIRFPKKMEEIFK